jgi:site-specific DNA-methyltransferase (cytosine-N4-specific)
MTVRGKATEGIGWVKDLGLAALTPAYSTEYGAIFQEDALKVMRQMPAECIDMVMTSPPFALTRKKEYGNEPVDKYLEWFLPFCLEIKRILKPRGSFVLDIGGAWLPGHPVRSVYHFEVACRLAREFKLAQEFYWYNPARLPSPAEWVNVRRVRVKDAVNMVWWFGKTENPKADNRKILQPYSDSMRTLLRDGYKAKLRPSGHDISEKFSRDNGGAIPPNLITIANTESNSYYLRACREHGIKPHPARYPAALVQFFLKFLSHENDLVYDPFAGSNVTGWACEGMGRRWLGTEITESYIEGSAYRFDEMATEMKPKKPRTGKKKGGHSVNGHSENGRLPLHD